MIHITRNEINGVLQGFSFYSESPIALLVHDGTNYYSITRYRGNCDVGAPSALAQAVAFQTDEEATSFIDANGLTLYNPEPAQWHDENSAIRVILTLLQNANLLQGVPEIGLYLKQNGIIPIIDDNYVYVYLNYLHNEHRQIIEAYGGRIDP
jgi:hypothetical protein